jgi:hypothetical protein
MNKIYSIVFIHLYLASSRSIPYQYDNQGFESDPRNGFHRPVNKMNIHEQVPTIHSSRHTPQMSEIEAGRTKLHRLLDEVLDKAEPNQSYNPDSEIQRRKRHRQRRGIHSMSYDPRNPLIINDNQENHHTPMIPHVSERPDPSLLRFHYNPYEAGDRAREIQRGVPVELMPPYSSDDNDIGQHYNRASFPLNPPLYFDNPPDRAMTATDVYGIPKRQARTRLETDREAMMRQMGQRQHKFDDDAVYIDTIPKHRDGPRVQIHNGWPETENNNDNFFHLNHSDLNKDPTKRNDYRDEYLMAKQSVVSTKNLISSIHDDLQNIVSQPSSDNYHA